MRRATARSAASVCPSRSAWNVARGRSASALRGGAFAACTNSLVGARAIASPSATSLGLVRPASSTIASASNRRNYASASSGTVIDIENDADFQARVLEASSTVPIIVDCYADLTPVLQQVVEAQGGKVILAKVNVDDVPGVADQLMVSSIPAVFAFWNREAVNRFIGGLPKKEVERFVADVLEHTAAGTPQ